MSDISQSMCSIAEALNCQFTLRDQAIAAEKVFASDGLLPSMFRRADQLCNFCLGYGLGVTYDDMPNATLGVVTKLDDSVAMSLRLLCLTDILIELIQMAPSRDQIPMDDLLYD